MPNFFLLKVLEHGETQGKPLDFLRQLLVKGLGHLIAFYVGKIPDSSALKRPRNE